MDEPSSGTRAFKALKTFIIDDDVGFLVLVLLVVVPLTLWILRLRRHLKDWRGRWAPGDPAAPEPPPSPAASLASNDSVIFVQMPLPAEASGSEAKKQFSTGDDSEVKTKSMSSVDCEPVLLSFKSQQPSVAYSNNGDEDCSVETREHLINTFAKKKRSDLETGTHSKSSLYDGLYTKDA